MRTTKQTVKLSAVIKLIVGCLLSCAMSAKAQGTAAKAKSSTREKTQNELRAELQAKYPIFNKELVIDSVVEYYEGGKDKSKEKKYGRGKDGTTGTHATELKECNFLVLDENYISEFEKTSIFGDKFRKLAGHEIVYDETSGKFGFAVKGNFIVTTSKRLKSVLCKEITIISVDGNRVELEVSEDVPLNNYAPDKERSKFSTKIYVHIKDSKQFNLIENISKTVLGNKDVTITYGEMYRSGSLFDLPFRPREGCVYPGYKLYMKRQERLTKDKVAFFLQENGTLWEYDKPVWRYIYWIGGSRKIVKREEVGKWNLVVKVEDERPVLYLEFAYKKGKKDVMVINQLGQTSSIRSYPEPPMTVTCSACEEFKWSAGYLKADKTQPKYDEDEDDEEEDDEDGEDEDDETEEKEISRPDPLQWVDKALTLHNYEVIARRLPINYDQNASTNGTIYEEYAPITEQEKRQYLNFGEHGTGMWIMGKKKITLSYERDKESYDIIFKYEEFESEVAIGEWTPYSTIMGAELIDNSNKYNPQGDVNYVKPRYYRLKMTNPHTKKLETLIITEASSIEQARKDLKIEMEE